MLASSNARRLMTLRELKMTRLAAAAAEAAEQTHSLQTALHEHETMIARDQAALAGLRAWYASPRAELLLLQGALVQSDALVTALVTRCQDRDEALERLREAQHRQRELEAALILARRKRWALAELMASAAQAHRRLQASSAEQASEAMITRPNASRGSW